MRRRGGGIGGGGIGGGGIGGGGIGGGGIGGGEVQMPVSRTLKPVERSAAL